MWSPCAVWAWVWQPVGSPLQILAGAIVLAGLAVFAYARTSATVLAARIGLLLMRLAMIAAVTVLLLGPSAVPPQLKKPRRPKLSVLLDTSQSMLTADCHQQSRFKFAATEWLGSRRLADLRQEYDLELHGFDTEVRPISAASLEGDESAVVTGQATRLADSVAGALSRMPSGQEGTAMLVISDGRDSEETPIQAAASLAQKKQVPVYTVALGGRSQQSDVAVLAVPMQDYLLANEPGSILVKVYQVGFDEASTTLRLRRGDQEQTVPIAFNHKRVVEVQLTVQHDAGHYEYTVEADPLTGEVENTNNLQRVFIDVQKKRLKILVLEGQPFWDSKFLAQSLRKDDRIELTQITQVSRKKRETIVTRVEEGAPAVPRTAEAWSKFDVVILGQSLEHVLDETTAGLLADFVSNHGGHVVFARGLAYDRKSNEGQRIGKALSTLEPVVWGSGFMNDLTLSLTPAGRTSPWFSSTKTGVNIEQALARLPGFQSMPIIEREKVTAVVLARASPGGAPGNKSHPAVVSMTYGRGTVVAVLGEGLWRWGLLAPEHRDLSGFYDTFWSNLVRGLAMGGDFQPGQQVTLRLSRRSVRLGDPLTVDVVFKHTPLGGVHPKLEWTDPQGVTSDVALLPLAGRDPRFRATLEPDKTGVYVVTLHTPGMVPAKQEHKFNVYHINEERLATAANPLPLQVLAEHSGGLFFEADQADALLPRLQRQRASMLVPPQLEYLWDQWTIMLVLLVWTGCEWLLRRAVDLL